MSARLNSTTSLLRRVSGSDGRLGEMRTEREQLPGRRSELVLDLLAPQEVAVQGVVEVDTEAAVQVLAGMQRAHPAVARPELRDRDLFDRRPAFRQAPGGL